MRNMSVYQFQKLLDITLNKVKDSPNDNKSQIVVIQSSTGKIYDVVISDVTRDEETQTDKLISEISNASDTIIKKIICVWRNGTVDLPSFQFRKKYIKKMKRTGMLKYC